MKRRFLHFSLLLVFLELCGISFGQNFSFEDFEKEKDSEKRVEMGLLGLQHYRRNNIDSLEVLAFCFSAGDSIDNHKVNDFESALAKRFMGSLEIRTDNINRGIKLLQKAGEIFANHNSYLLLSETENDIGNAFYLLGNYNQAVNYYFKSIFHGSNSSDVTARYNGMIGIGRTLCAVGDTAQGTLFVQEYLERSLRDNKYEAAADACGYLGMISGHKGNVELMSAYYIRANLYAGRSSSKTHQANALTNKAINYFYQNKIDSAMILFNESLLVRKEVGATRPIVESFYNLAIINIELGILDEAKKYAEQGEALSSEQGIISWQLDCLKLLLEIAEKSNDLTNVESIKFDIKRIEEELKEMSSVNSEIIDLAVDFTSLHDYPIRRSHFWEIVSGLALLLSSGVLFYQNRINSTSGGTRA